MFQSPLSLWRYPVCCALAAAAILFAVAAPSVAGCIAPAADESKAPAERDEQSQERHEEGLVNNQGRPGLKPAMRDCRTAAHEAVDARRQFPPAPSRYAEGHRLSNGLLAPLTC